MKTKRFIIFSRNFFLLNIILFSGLLSCSNSKLKVNTGGAQLDQINVLTQSQKKDGWTLLFNGKTLDGWQGVNPAGDPYKSWSINNGVLSPETLNNKVDRDIITKEQFNNFELSLEFKIVKGTNSGIKYVVKNDYSENNKVYLGLEYQIVDTAGTEYGQREKFRSLASLYDLISAKSSKAISFNHWNKARIVKKGNQVEHWLNGNKVLSYTIGNPNFHKLIEQSKYKGYKNFGESNEGHILLQNEGTPVSFRKIAIKIRK